MKPEELVAQANRIISDPDSTPASQLAEAREFVRIYAGEKSAFYKQLQEFSARSLEHVVQKSVSDVLGAFIRYIESGLLNGISIQRSAQIDVVSDFLSQADALLVTARVHPAAPTVIIGAALEEFLRNWVEEANLKLGGKKPGMEAYSGALREADLITKQDSKDITSWAGLRNHAAHGEWDDVNDRHRIRLMLDGVNMFMRKYTRGSA